jgi:hypothetical protein
MHKEVTKKKGRDFMNGNPLLELGTPWANGVFKWMEEELHLLLVLEGMKDPRSVHHFFKARGTCELKRNLATIFVKIMVAPTRKTQTTC